jgi:hypothetical protein
MNEIDLFVMKVKLAGALLLALAGAIARVFA